MEKAHPDGIQHSVAGAGRRLTDERGRTVTTFRNTVVIMTSNLGSDLIQEALCENWITVEYERDGAGCG